VELAGMNAAYNFFAIFTGHFFHVGGLVRRHEQKVQFLESSFQETEINAAGMAGTEAELSLFSWRGRIMDIRFPRSK
jgi:hypothetical protein